MNRWDTFTFRVSQEERQTIANLASWLQRSQSDAVRFVVIEVARQLAQAENTAPIAVLPSNKEQTGNHVTS